jgi:hypothetical protein
VSQTGTPIGHQIEPPTSSCRQRGSNREIGDGRVLDARAGKVAEAISFLPAYLIP